MSKVILSLFSLLLLLIFPKIILAANITTRITTPDPPDIFPDTPQIVIEVSSDENSFDPGTDYTFSAWNGSRVEGSCNVSQYNKRSNSNERVQLIVSSNKITASWQRKDCMAEVGTYNFQLWAGRGTPDRNNNSLIPTGSTFSFLIQQKGGQVPQLSPLQETVLLGTKPTVLVSNARVGNTYTFWWDGSQQELAEKKTPSDNDLINGILPVLLNLSGGNFRAGQRSKICMEIGDYRFPTGLICRYSTFFNFSNITPPRNTQCSILPSLNPTVTDDVNLSITNAVPNTNYTLYLKKDGNDFKTIPSQIVNPLGNLIISLGTKMSQGTYATRVVDSATNQTLDPCTIGFTVVPASVPVPSSTPCTDPAKCSSGGGQSCSDDLNNPGFITAIGCIHTNPTELIKDLMKFVVGIAGGLAFLMMLLGAFQMLTSAGNPETLSAGRDRLTSAVIGLLFVIFAILLLQIIGVDILKIPGFGR